MIPLIADELARAGSRQALLDSPSIVCHAAAAPAVARSDVGYNICETRHFYVFVGFQEQCLVTGPRCLSTAAPGRCVRRHTSSGAQNRSSFGRLRRRDWAAGETDRQDGAGQEISVVVGALARAGVLAERPVRRRQPVPPAEKTELSPRGQ